MRDLYEILGVARTATLEEIKRAYRKAARKTHPDQGGDPERFREVQTAFDILSDEERRRAYDESGDAGAAEQGLTRIEVTLMGIIAAAIGSGRVGPGTNLVAYLKGGILDGVEMKTRERDNASAEVARLEGFKGQHKRKTEGPNIIERAIDDRLRALRCQVSACEVDLEDGFAMLEYLAGYDFTGRAALKTAHQAAWDRIPALRRMMTGGGFGE